MHVARKPSVGSEPSPPGVKATDAAPSPASTLLISGSAGTLGTAVVVVVEVGGSKSADVRSPSSEKYVDSPGISAGEKLTVALNLSALMFVKNVLGPSYPVRTG